MTLPTDSMATSLALARYRLTARLDRDLHLPDYAGSLLRGVFGAALRRSACMTAHSDCKTCPLWRSCPYPAIFEPPPQPTQFAQQFNQVPNPYVIEPPAIGTRCVAAGEPLQFHMVLIGADTLRQLPLIVHAWQRALRHGLGRERVGGVLQAVEQVDAGGVITAVLDAGTGRVLPHAAHWPMPADVSRPVDALTLQFDTPLRLQHQGRPLAVRELGPRTLVSQMLRRINLMLDLHLGIRPAPFDARALVALAENLQDDRSGLRWQDWTRYSARQGQEMNLGGVLGTWSLHGELAPLLPWLRLGQWLHLGKNATMGLGRYRLTEPEPATPRGAAPSCTET